jgi:hypothetical protein
MASLGGDVKPNDVVAIKGLPRTHGRPARHQAEIDCNLVVPISVYRSGKGVYAMEASAVEGGCLCGAVRFTISSAPLFCGHCHCSMCRRAHGAGYVTWIGVPYDHFQIAAGADRLTHYRSSEHGTRSFCGTCGSTLFFESTDHPTWIDVVLANVDGKIDLAPQAHVHFDDRAEWIHVADDLQRFGGKTGLEPL